MGSSFSSSRRSMRESRPSNPFDAVLEADKILPQRDNLIFKRGKACGDGADRLEQPVKLFIRPAEPFGHEVAHVFLLVSHFAILTNLAGFFESSGPWR